MYQEVLNIVCFQTFSVKRKENDLHKNIRFQGACEKCIFSYNFTDRTKFMFLFHLQRLGAQRRDSRFFQFSKNKMQKKIFFFSKIYVLCNFCGFVLFFIWKHMENIFSEIAALLAIKFPKNNLCFNHLRQKLWEKIHFLQPKVNFSGEGKNT